MINELTQLKMYGAAFDDLQKYRIRVSNRLGAYDDPMGMLPSILAQTKEQEHQLSLAIQRVCRKAIPAPVLEWQKKSQGVGLHLLGLLVSSSGNPHEGYPRLFTGELDPENPPFVRRVSDFRQYCGWGDPARKRKKNMSAEDAKGMGNQKAKTYVYLLATSAIKEPGRAVKTNLDPEACKWPYRKVYETARVEYATREGWTDAHQHNAAIRKVAQTILRDLWVVWPH